MIHSFKYEVRAKVSWPLRKMQYLKKLADLHYDVICRSLAQQGGVIFGLINIATWKQEPDAPSSYQNLGISISWTEADIMCKILEQADSIFAPDGMTFTTEEAFKYAREWRDELRYIKDQLSAREESGSTIKTEHNNV